MPAPYSFLFVLFLSCNLLAGMWDTRYDGYVVNGSVLNNGGELEAGTPGVTAFEPIKRAYESNMLNDLKVFLESENIVAAA